MKIFLLGFLAGAMLSLPVDSSWASKNPAPGKIKEKTRDKTSCLPPKLWGFLQQTANHFHRPVHILSAYRPRKDNERRGGAKNSMHISCKAADITVPGISGHRLAGFLAGLPGRGGVGYYCNNRIHIDVGRRRQWGPCQPGRRLGYIAEAELAEANSCGVEHEDLLPSGFSNIEQMIVYPEDSE